MWQRLHLKYKIKMDGATPSEIEKFLAIPGHQSLRNRAKTLRVKARKEHGEGEGAKDLVNRDESGGSKASSEMTVLTGQCALEGRWVVTGVGHDGMGFEPFLELVSSRA